MDNYNPNFKMTDRRNEESKYYDTNFKSYMNILPMGYVEKGGKVFNCIFGQSIESDSLIKLNEE